MRLRDGRRDETVLAVDRLPPDEREASLEFLRELGLSVGAKIFVAKAPDEDTIATVRGSRLRATAMSPAFVNVAL